VSKKIKIPKAIMREAAAQFGSMGGTKNTKKQQEHRKTVASKAMAQANRKFEPCKSYADGWHRWDTTGHCRSCRKSRQQVRL